MIAYFTALVSTIIGQRIALCKRDFCAKGRRDMHLAVRDMECRAFVIWKGAALRDMHLAVRDIDCIAVVIWEAERKMGRERCLSHGSRCKKEADALSLTRLRRELYKKDTDKAQVPIRVEFWGYCGEPGCTAAVI